MPSARKRGECHTCGAKCCRYVVVEIGKPRTRIDREEIRWFLAHENVMVFIDHDDGSWNVQFTTRCRHLDRRNRCRIYGKRYQVCAEHDPADCEGTGLDVNATVFTRPEEYDAWRVAQAVKHRRKRRLVRKRK